jgi:hypothetical protein
MMSMRVLLRASAGAARIAGSQEEEWTAPVEASVAKSAERGSPAFESAL